MQRLQRWASALLLILGCTLILAGVGLWARQSLIPGWRFRSADTPSGRGNGVVVAATLEATPERRSPAAMATLRPTRSAVTETSGTQTLPPSQVGRRRQAHHQAISVKDTPSPTETATPAGPPPATEPPSRLVIPAIDLDTDVVPMGWQVKQTADGENYSDWVLPKDEAGWHKNSALPGRVGNTVLSGHNNIYGEVFRYLKDIEPGDTVRLYVDDTAYRYVVAEKYIVKEKGVPYEQRLENAQFMAQTDDERLTLITCWPYETNTHRLILIARPVVQ